MHTDWDSMVIFAPQRRDLLNKYTMEKLSTVEERLPSLLLSLPEKLINETPVGDKEKYRSFYLELVAMRDSIDLARLQKIKTDLASVDITFTRHESTIGNIQDWWFGTRRVEGDAYLIVLYGLVSAYINAITDLNSQTHTLCLERVSIISVGLSLMAEVSYEYLYDESVTTENLLEATGRPSQGNVPQRPERIMQPMQRWRAGHQLFFVSIQTLNILFSMTRRSVDAEEWSLADTYLRKAAFFMGMSARSIEYASNYDRIQYEEQVRALMPPGFSGLMLADHTLLINLLKNLRETVFSRPPEALRESIRIFLEAMEECYEAHNMICESFVDNGPSLRDLNSPKDSPPPAVQMLDKLKNKRKKMLSETVVPQIPSTRQN